MLGRRLDDSYPAEVRDAVTVLTLAKIGANSAARFAPPFLATIASGIDVKLTTAGAALAVGELTGLSAPLLTRVAGRFSRRTAVSAGMAGIAVATVVCATSQHVVQLALGLAMITMSKIVFDLGIIAWLSERVPYARLGRVVGLTETAWAAALLIGVAAMGVVTGLTSWRWGYALAAAAAVMLSVLVRRRLADGGPAHAVGAAAAGHRAPLGAGWWVVAGNLVLTAAAQSVFVTFGTWLEDDFGYSETAIAAVIFAIGAVELAASSSSMRFVDRWGKGRSVIASASVMVPCGVALAIVNDHIVPGLILLAVFIGLFEFAVVCSLSMASNLVPGHAARGVGMMVGAGTLGRAVMSPLATAALSAQGMSLPASIGAGCAAAGLGCQLTYRRLRPGVG